LAVLGRYVVPHVRHALQPERGAGDDDRPAARGAQVRDGGLGRVPDAGQVGVDHVLPGGLAELVQRPEAEDPRVGGDDVQPPELGHTVVQRRLHRSVVAHVGLDGHDPAVQRLDLLDRFRQVGRGRHRVRHAGDLIAEVDGDDVRSLLRQPDRVAAALAARRAGDEGDLAFQLAHRRVPL
jgi:hypothetical protein